MPATRAARQPLTFLPRLTVADPLGAYWLRQVTLRLRREICWLWRERGLLAGAGTLSSADGALLPPFTDRLTGVLDQTRYDEQRDAFFKSDETAAYLSGLIAEELPAPRGRGARSVERGGLSWVARELQLTPADCFVLALSLTPVVDSSAGTVFAACLNDSRHIRPTLALAQRLWDTPEDVLALTDAAHALHRTGVLDACAEWDVPLTVSGAVARQLLFPAAPLPTAFAPLPAASDVEARQIDLALARIKTAVSGRSSLLPIVGPPGAPLAAAASRVAAALECDGVQPSPGARATDVPVLATLAWLRGACLYVPVELLAGERRDEAARSPIEPPLVALPTTLLVGMSDDTLVRRLSDTHALPPLRLLPLDYHARLERWRALMPAAKRDADLSAAIADCARRFRHEAPAIERIAAALGALGVRVTPSDLYAVCRADVELGELAQPVSPRFELADLMLPAKQSRQVEELIAAARALTAVHYEWGTARAWNESGLSALFAGAPGTGKTMAAEVIANAVGMPLFRIDLSQVVNKYIGETEKNLRRLFDAADASDVILFFDEADALFGKRTEVKDAHDRYANLEISYLLERMERFKGLAILATNRKKDLDEAFLRRLRYLIEFPLPGVPERLRIWRASIPREVDGSALDLPFLAERFALTGGHIRAVVFQACLQSAAGSAKAPRRLDMPAVLLAVRRELDKLGRAISLDQFGAWASSVEE
jgi:hypothetical protein